MWRKEGKGVGLEEGQPRKEGDVPLGNPLGEKHTAGWEKRRREEKGEESQLLDEKGHVQIVKISLTSIIS